MGRFLVAWEYGEGLGHVRRILPIGRALRERGHGVAFAFRDATRLGAASAEGFAAWAAPKVPRRTSFNPTPVSASDVLLNLGFDDVAAMRGALRGWSTLLACVAPDVVVCDYAPGALLAAAQRGVRRATVGSGFALPLATSPLPAIRHAAGDDEPSRRILDARLVEAASRACGAANPVDVHSLFRGEVNLLATLPELDPFGPRDEAYLGPIGVETGGLEAAWASTARPRVLAYLKPRDARFAGVLDALRGVAGEALVAAPGMSPDAARAASDARVRVFPSALALPPLLDGVDLAVGHGGPGFSLAALLAGTPLVLLPMQLEQEMVAVRLARQGLAVLGGMDGTREAMQSALGDAGLRERARQFARDHAPGRYRDAAGEAAARLEALAP
ncbi:MAG TPA: nucleotide disphospho-sugar-binding domain-containing protein [Usitatibacter sp.]|jgi:UDP:flavonoid glycosyltransferase YjiC (YdhE family)|nr:nucleotide disphospho-sugar-binding domain-containing protein [Usitatibacter sp.]